MVFMTVSLDVDLAEKLDRLASKVGRARSDLAAEAIADYLNYMEWQIIEIQAGIAEADRGEFALAEEFASVVGRYSGG